MEQQIKTTESNSQRMEQQIELLTKTITNSVNQQSQQMKQSVDQLTLIAVSTKTDIKIQPDRITFTKPAGTK